MNDEQDTASYDVRSGSENENQKKRFQKCLMNMPLEGRDLRNFEFLFRKFNLKATEHLNVAKGEIRMHFSTKKEVQSLTCEHNKFINIFVIGYIRVSTCRGISCMK